MRALQIAYNGSIASLTKGKKGGLDLRFLRKSCYKLLQVISCLRYKNSKNPHLQEKVEFCGFYLTAVKVNGRMVPEMTIFTQFLAKNVALIYQIFPGRN